MTPTAGFPRVGIIGLGLMGGSLARALARLPDPPRVTAWSREDADLRAALDDGVIADATDRPDTVCSASELVVYGTPVGVTVELMAEHAPLLEGRVATDLGSVKAPVVEQARALGLDGTFVGGHPMAGDHRSGYGAARAALFEGARVWLCGPARGDARDRVAALWRALGAEPAELEARAHDGLVAWSSHLPQVVASALGDVLATAEIDLEAMGAGGRDTTRLAASSGAMWADILVHNAEHMVPRIEELVGSLESLAAAIRTGDADTILERFERARRWREEP